MRKKYLGIGLDSIVIKENGKILKKYWRKKETVLKYHNLQNKIAKKGKLIFDLNGNIGPQKFYSVEVETLSLEETVSSIKNKLIKILGLNFCYSRQKFIDGKTFQTRIISKKYKKIIMENISNYYKKFLSYRNYDLHPKNIKVIGVEGGILKIIVTDIGASIRLLLFRNSSSGGQ